MFSSNVSSIGSHQIWMDVNAHNTANVNTDGFDSSDTKITEGVDSQPVPNIRKEEKNTEKSSTDLAKELTDHIPIEKSVAVNVKAIRTQDEIYGTLLNIKS